MEISNLLETAFIVHYNLPNVDIHDIYRTTDSPYFELEDTKTGIVFSEIENNSTAKYSNHNNYYTYIIFYEQFINKFNERFKSGKRKCDLIICTQNKKYFLLNELKNRKLNQNKDIESDAIDQLTQSLKLLRAVAKIKEYISGFTIKQCCLFNKQTTNAPGDLNAVTAFNRINDFAPVEGFELKTKDIEDMGFTYFERTGTQSYSFL
jgi:hypothetical protein